MHALRVSVRGLLRLARAAESGAPEVVALERLEEIGDVSIFLEIRAKKNSGRFYFLSRWRGLAAFAEVSP